MHQQMNNEMPSTTLTNCPIMAHDILDNELSKTEVKLEEFDQSYYNTATLLHLVDKEPLEKKL